jgi:hypothetical protein
MAFSRPRMTPEGAQKRAKVVELRAKRWSFAEIGTEIGLTPQRCGQLYAQALAMIPAKSVDEHRQEAGTLCDQAVRDLLVIATDVKTGLRYRIDSWCAIKVWEEHRARILGTNAPTRTEVLTLSGIDQQIADLELELERQNLK